MDITHLQKEAREKHAEELTWSNELGDVNTTINELVAHVASTIEAQVREEYETTSNQYKGKLWSTAVQKAFEAPFPEVAVQYLVSKIAGKTKEDIATKLLTQIPEMRHSQDCCDFWERRIHDVLGITYPKDIDAARTPRTKEGV